VNRLLGDIKDPFERLVLVMALLIVSTRLVAEVWSEFARGLIVIGALLLTGRILWRLTGRL
jgi:hypothetical protein